MAFARHDHDAYTAVMAERMASLGVQVLGAHAASDPGEAVQQSDAIIVGGGNTFLLLRDLQRFGLIEPIRERVADGVPYFGASAGSNVAGPSIRTTNDMPIVETDGFAALQLVPFQINPHYVDPAQVRVGETRLERLQEFLEQNDATVVGLREPSWVLVNDDQMTLCGDGGGVLLQRGNEPASLAAGADLSDVLTRPPIFDAPC